MIKLPGLVFISLLFTCCQSQQQHAYRKAKKDHDVRMALTEALPDIYEKMIADSMKRWIPVFKKVFVNDQKNRIIGYGFTSEGLKEQHILDSQNLIIVTAYLDSFGWPAKYDAGFIGQRAVGMVIQHAPLYIQEKYYPRLVNAYTRDSFLFETVAMLEDRINLRRHRYQYYGSQIIYYNGKPNFYPIYNVDSADIRRKALNMLMPTLKDYMAIFKEEFNLADYKRLLPKLIDSFKVADEPGLHFEIKK